MTGIPGETDRDLEETIELLGGIGAHDGQVSPLVWYPGTRIFAEGVKNGTVGAGLFEERREAALYVRTDPFVARSTRMLLDGIALNVEANSFTREDFQAQKRDLGYCHVTNVMAGEMYESRGNWQLAEAEYREITGREPENPWGWLLLGELLAGRGNVREARRAFESLVAIVPAHAPGYAALGDLSCERGELVAARKQYRKALSLDPHDARSAEGLDAIGG
jgi:tetratricopeptide (TPR) repeat protein